MAVAFMSAFLVDTVVAQVGKPFIHDPSTIMECEGKYYTFGTGGGGLISEDGWTWNSGAVRPGGGAAPDVVRIGDRYLVAYGATGGGLGGGHNGVIYTMWNKTLDPQSPDFGYSEPVAVASSDGIEDNDAIDPGLLLDPTDGRLWMSYGTYFGFIRLVELDPKTGKRVEGNQPVDIAIDCEATDLIYRDGWYYLLGTHGTCCDGPNSTYNIVVGRSRKVTGPYMDNVGRSMLEGGGRMVVAAGGRVTGPGHFGLYEIESERRGYALELAVDFVRMPEGVRWFEHTGPIEPIASQTLADVIDTWPTGNIGVRAGDYMFRPHQRWTITAVRDAGGYLGAPYYKIVIEGTERALAATAEAEVVTVPAFTGAPEQLWRIDQLTDGTYRIMPKEIPGSTEKLALISIGDSTPTLAKFDKDSDNSKWNFKAH